MKNVGFDFSRVMLGTVQFGLDYGIARGGRPDYAACRDIVVCALESGINCFDTAAGYGESEQILGKILAELKVTDQVVVVSKSKPISDVAVSSDQVQEFVEQSLLQSLKNLQMESLPVFLFHIDKDLPWMDALRTMKDKGLVGRVGISVDTEEGAKQAVKNDLVEAIQLPHNLFDHRFAGKMFNSVEERKIKLFARSAFLQGLLLMPEERIPKKLHEVVPVRRKIEKLARDAGMWMPELCLRYSLSFSAITSVLIGVDSVAQLRDNAAIMQRGSLDQDLISKIDACVPDWPESIVRPICWTA
jgi:aryl-alcohol dehydrogenase-like predicted oxidoreductase